MRVVIRFVIVLICAALRDHHLLCRREGCIPWNQVGPTPRCSGYKGRNQVGHFCLPLGNNSRSVKGRAFCSRTGVGGYVGFWSTRPCHKIMSVMSDEVAGDRRGSLGDVSSRQADKMMYLQHHVDLLVEMNQIVVPTSSECSKPQFATHCALENSLFFRPLSFFLGTHTARLLAMPTCQFTTCRNSY